MKARQLKKRVFKRESFWAMPNPIPYNWAATDGIVGNFRNVWELLESSKIGAISILKLTELH